VMVALVRIALTTHTFSGYCSTTELQGQILKKTFIKNNIVFYHNYKINKKKGGTRLFY